MKKIAFILAFVMSAALVGCDGGDKIKRLEGDLLQSAYVRYLGRSEMKDGLMYCYNTGTGFSVSFYGTRLNAEFVCTNTDSETERPYYQVFTDGEASPEEGKVVEIDKADKNVKLVSELNEGFHTVTVIKRSESSEALRRSKAYPRTDISMRRHSPTATGFPYRSWAAAASAATARSARPGRNAPRKILPACTRSGISPPWRSARISNSFQTAAGG